MFDTGALTRRSTQRHPPQSSTRIQQAPNRHAVLNIGRNGLQEGLQGRFARVAAARCNHLIERLLQVAEAGRGFGPERVAAIAVAVELGNQLLDRGLQLDRRARLVERDRRGRLRGGIGRQARQGICRGILRRRRHRHDGQQAAHEVGGGLLGIGRQEAGKVRARLCLGERLLDGGGQGAVVGCPGCRRRACARRGLRPRDGGGRRLRRQGRCHEIVIQPSVRSDG